jgi:hypothetical protein
LRKNVADKHVRTPVIQKGMMFILCGDSKNVASRLGRGKRIDASPDYLEELQANLEEIYRGATFVENRQMELEKVVKEIARVIFRGEFNPINLDRRLRSLELRR